MQCKVAWEKSCFWRQGIFSKLSHTGLYFSSPEIMSSTVLTLISCTFSLQTRTKCYDRCRCQRLVCGHAGASTWSGSYIPWWVAPRQDVGKKTEKQLLSDLSSRTKISQGAAHSPLNYDILCIQKVCNGASEFTWFWDGDDSRHF